MGEVISLAAQREERARWMDEVAGALTAAGQLAEEAQSTAEELAEKYWPGESPARAAHAWLRAMGWSAAMEDELAVTEVETGV